MDDHLARKGVLKFLKSKGSPKGQELIEIHAHLARIALPFQEVKSLLEKMAQEGLLAVKEGPAPRQRLAPYFRITEVGMKKLKETA